MFAALKQNPLIKNSFILFVGMMIANFGGFVFHLMLGRLLDIKSFGEFEALVSLLYIISVPASTFTTMMTRYTAEFKAQNEEKKIEQLFGIFTRLFLFWSLFLFVIFCLVSPLLAQMLKLDTVWPIIILGIALVISLFDAINSGILNGLQRFKTISLLSILSMILKILIALVLVKLTFGVSGAVSALAGSMLVTYLLGVFALRKFLNFRASKLQEMKELIFYMLPTFVIMFALNFYYSIDVLLVKYFFSPEEAGQYGAISVIGRVIVFVSGIIVAVLFPMLSHARRSGEQSKLFRHALLLVGFISVCGIAGYFLFPQLIVSVMVGSKYLTIVPFIGWFGLSMGLYSMINLLSKYFLSNCNFKSLYIFASGLLLQIVLICFFHSSLLQVILMMNISLAVILICLSLFYWRVQRLALCPK